MVVVEVEGRAVAAIGESLLLMLLEDRRHTNLRVGWKVTGIKATVVVEVLLGFNWALN